MAERTVAVTFKTGGEAPYVEEGWYKATLNQLEERTAKEAGNVYVTWHFGLDGGGGPLLDGRGFDLDFWVFTSQSIGPKSNARPIVEALLGRSLTNDDSGEDLPELVLNQSCYVKIADFYRDDGEFGGSRPVKGSWTSIAKWEAQQRTAPRGRPVAATAPPTRRQPAPSPGEPEELEAIPF